MKNANLLIVALLLTGCGSPEMKPVDIYPEDMCSHCRMAISDQSFSSEIMTENGEAFKFDDVGCMEAFRKESPGLRAPATFVKDFDTKRWLRFEEAAIAQTDVKTPMGSGRVAFADPARARAFAAQHPSRETAERGEKPGGSR